MNTSHEMMGEDTKSIVIKVSSITLGVVILLIVLSPIFNNIKSVYKSQGLLCLLPFVIELVFQFFIFWIETVALVVIIYKYRHHSASGDRSWFFLVINSGIERFKNIFIRSNEEIHTSSALCCLIICVCCIQYLYCCYRTLNVIRKFTEYANSVTINENLKKIQQHIASDANKFSPTSEIIIPIKS